MTPRQDVRKRDYVRRVLLSESEACVVLHMQCCEEVQLKFVMANLPRFKI